MLMVTKEFTEHYISSHCLSCKRYSDTNICFDHPKHTIDIAVERCQDGMVDIMDML